jgi:hypothetical protein
MKSATTKSTKVVSGKSGQNTTRPKSNLKAAVGKYKGIILESEDCWDEDLKKTIAH